MENENLIAMLTNTREQIIAKENEEVENEVKANYNTVVAPHFVEIETKKANALSALTDQYNKDVAEINANVESAKAKFAESQKAVITSSVHARYSKVIKNLDDQIAMLQ